ncbi:MAG: hypothetical protein AB1941_21825 [Gemmatimonadota bacterium]
MQKRSSKGRQTPDDNDPNVVAFGVIEQATRDDDDEPEAPPEPPPEKNPAAVALGRLGGRKGGKARAEALSPEQRKEIASRAARARWEKKEREGGS